jgi:hypothetical protein
MTKYQLGRAVLFHQPEIDLTRAEYDAILDARRRVLEGLAIEDLFNLMLGNYEEFERELLSIALTHATYFGADEEWNDAIDTIQLVARRFANLLTTTQGYCDQIPHSISSLYGNPSAELEAVGGYFRHEHANGLGYRGCTELRRHMQHRGSAVHGSSGGGGWAERPDGQRVYVYSFVPTVSLERLRADPKVKRPVLDEMERHGRRPSAGWKDSIDLRPFVREYVSALGRIHLKVRQMIAPEVARCDVVISEAVGRFLALPDSGGDAIGLAAMELNDEGLREEGMLSTPVMMEQIERRRQLEQRNHLPTHFHTNVITNEIDPPKKWPKR